MNKVIPFSLNPMHKRPPAGVKISVFQKNGDVLNGCFTTLVHVGDRSGIIIYHKRKAIDENLAKGWQLEK